MARITVLTSLRTIRPTTNPYLVMLTECLRRQPELDLIHFSYRTAIFGRVDVFHLHWPEIFLEGRTPTRKMVRQVLFVLVLARFTLSRRPLVRTVHNLERPSGLRRHEHAILDWVDRLTVVRIRLNEFTPAEPGQEWVLIPHGHYREWFSDREQADPVAGRFGYVGLIRRYKGVEGLISAFRATDARGPDADTWSLRVSGQPSTPELAATVESLAAPDPRIGLDLRFISDAEWVQAVTSAELIVLPYRLMHNSGGTLACLSLARPVLIPDNELNRSLRTEVGGAWVQTFSGELDADDLITALARVRAADGVGHAAPDLSGRGWSETAAEHESAFRRAICISRRRTRSRAAMTEHR